MRLAPKNGHYLSTLAEVHFQRREFELARKWIRRSIELEPADAFLKAQLIRMQGDDPSAPLPEH